MTIAKLLGHSDEEKLETRTELELVRLVLADVRQKVPRSSEGLNDSLAFPLEARKRVNMIEANSLWHKLDKFNDQLRQDFTCRRQMLLKRLDCTVESFKWKGSASKANHGCSGDQKGTTKSLNDRIHEAYETIRVKLKDEPQVGLPHLLAARESECDRLLNEKISSRGIDCMIAYGKSVKNKEVPSESVNLKKVIIPHVPDRGGRADEHRPPPKETLGQRRGGDHRGRGRYENDRRRGRGSHAH